MPEYYISETTAILSNVSVIIAAWAAFVGISVWKKEFLGKRKIELAEEIFILFYQVRDAIKHIRSPASFGGEGASVKAKLDNPEETAEIPDQVFVVHERYDRHKEIFSRLQSLRYRFTLHFPEEDTKSFDEIENIVREIFSSTRKYTRIARVIRDSQNPDKEREKYRDKIQKCEDTFWLADEENETITPRLDSIIAKIDKICKKTVK